MQTWYNIKTSDTSAAISIFDEIGVYGVSAKNFLNDLRGVKADSIDVEINSPGGDVFAGLAMYNGLRASGKKINVRVLGVAASAASLVAMAGDTIDMPENTFLMIHNPWSFAVGDAEDMRDQADVLDKIRDSLVGTYAKRTGQKPEMITDMLDAETWLTAQEAVALGFADTVSDAISANAKYDPDRLPENVRAMFAAKAAPAPVVEAPPAKFEVTHAAQVQQIADAAGLPQYAALWASDPNIADAASAHARAQNAREVYALCKLADRLSMADAMIRNNIGLDAAREKVFSALAEGDLIDTSIATGTKQKSDAQSSAVKTADLWTARRKQHAN